VVFRDGTRYTALNAADEAILNEHFYRYVIKEPKPKPMQKQPTERQTEEPLHDESPSEPPKLKIKNSRELAGLEMSLEDAWKQPAERSRRNGAGLEKLVQPAQLALEDEKFGNMIPIYAVTAISNDQEEEINPKSFKEATGSFLAD
jgi:hypothetical protein